MGETAPARIWLDEVGIHYEAFPVASWILRLEDLVVVGEYTNCDFPFVDDYYFVFVLGPQDVYLASFYSEGREEFLKALGSKLGITLECRLIASTEFASNVLWPQALSGEPLYVFKRKPGLMSGLLRFIGWREFEVGFSPRVLATLNSRHEAKAGQIAVADVGNPTPERREM
jgi:hypothetical protein